MSDTEKCIESCNKLLRGEISATETYRQAIEKCDGANLEVLRRILGEHEESVTSLSSHVTDMGGTPATGSGAWGAFAKAVEGTAAFLGDSPAIAALIEGERHGIEEYNDALDDDAVMEEIKARIRVDMKPRLMEHINLLQGLPTV